MADEDQSPKAVHLDVDRLARRGYAEAILCEPKSVEHVVDIANLIAAGTVQTLFTRVRDDQVGPVLEALPDAVHIPEARMIAWPAQPPATSGGLVVVCAAGTSDLPVALEAERTARFLGRPTRLIVDVGVAGLHRILGYQEVLGSASAIVVAAGMDGALASVVAGLVSCPVVALPTSVGYGAAFNGVSALLSMLNACSPGIGVVNIDNGYGAGHLAAQIAKAGSSPQASV